VCPQFAQLKLPIIVGAPWLHLHWLNGFPQLPQLCPCIGLDVLC
jgi:hypothetical protein